MIGGRGRGSNLMSLVQEFENDPDIRATLVIAPSEGAPALEWARSQGLATAVISPKPTESYAERLASILGEVNWICLAGYLNLLPAEIIRAFPNRILNIHPALLPKFGGKGMYGLHVHEAVIAAGETRSGCSVHFVTEAYDEGEILAQTSCPVLPNDSPATLAARVLRLEHRLYPEALRIAIERSQS